MSASIQGLYVKTPIVASCAEHGHPLWRQKSGKHKDGTWYCPKCGSSPKKVIWREQIHRDIRKPIRITKTTCRVKNK